MSTTLIFVRHQVIGDRQYHHGDELPPDLLGAKEIDWWLDKGVLRECPDRRSLYRLLPRFSGAKEQEQLTTQERNNLCLSIE
jgi:hypothetical protein